MQKINKHRSMPYSALSTPGVLVPLRGKTDPRTSCYVTSVLNLSLVLLQQASTGLSPGPLHLMIPSTTQPTGSFSSTKEASLPFFQMRLTPCFPLVRARISLVSCSVLLMAQHPSSLTPVSSKMAGACTFCTPLTAQSAVQS